MLADLIRALRLVPRRRRWQWSLLIPLALSAAALESLGAGVVFALGTVLADPSRAAALPGAFLLGDLVTAAEAPRFIVALGIAVLVFYVGRAAFLVAFAWVQEAVLQRTAADVANRLFHAYLDAPYAFHLRRNSASLIQTASQSVDMVLSTGLGAALNIATEVLTLVGLVVVLTIAAPLATVVSVATLAVVLAVVLLATRRVAPRLGAEAKRTGEVLLQDLQQALASFKEVRILGAEQAFGEAFRRHRTRLAVLRARQGALSTAVRVFVETTFVAAMLAAALLMLDAGAGTSRAIGLMALYAYAGFRVVPAANRLTLNLTVFQGTRAHLSGLAADLDALPPSPNGATKAPGVAPLPFADRLEVSSVSYRYDDERGAALDGVTLSVRRGESIGIVGATGSGKSTLVDVILGLLTPQSGRILVDGRDISGQLRAWQGRVGYVPQAFALLDDSLRRNIAFGIDDRAIDEPRVRTVVDLAHLTDLVSRLPRGLDTRIGERGTRLSGGERQRVAIARALYRDPDVLVFDEATSALDAETEQAIIRAIDELRGIKTMLVVAHRLSTVQACDRIVFIQDGRITGDGSYQHLLDGHAAFRRMATAAS